MTDTEHIEKLKKELRQRNLVIAECASLRLRAENEARKAWDTYRDCYDQLRSTEDLVAMARQDLRTIKTVGVIGWLMVLALGVLVVVK